MKPVIRCHNLRFCHPGALPLCIDDLELHTGKVYAVEGPNGAGKSTLLWLLSGLLEPLSGAIEVFGKPLSSRDASVRRRITLLMEKPYLLQTTVQKNVEYGLAQRALSRLERRRRTTSALQALDIEHLSGTMASRLSHGEQKRVALARALALDTEVLLLDEPTSHVDRHTALLIEQTIEKLRGKTTIVVSTHDIAQSRRIADHIHTLIDGRLSPVSHENVFTGQAFCRDGARFVSLESGWEIPRPPGPQGPVEFLIDPNSIQLDAGSDALPQALVTGITMERAGVRVLLEGSPKIVARIASERLAAADIGVGKRIAIRFSRNGCCVLNEPKADS